MITVDTNIIAYFLLAGNRSEQAQKAYQQDPEWLAPKLWRSEFRNVLATYLRKKIITLDVAIKIMQQAEAMLRGHEYIVESIHVLELACQSACTAYDCEFVALAKDMNAKLLTVDKALLKAFPETALSLDEFVAG